MLAAYLEFAGLRLLGVASGVWGFVAAIALYVAVSLVTRAPEGKAADLWAI
jgi:SSS family solute:Na+ symporter